MTEIKKTDETSDRGYGRTLRGVVKSNKMTKTITVEVVRTVRHAKYNKFLKKRARYYAHDERSEAGIGDTVIIVESRPLSRLKRWRLQSIAEKAKV
ncbi:MAG: 30S ribosomal protein S17 [Deltaproteobacteria bacterium]|nr:30S ribosomal protein S17 [Deltaproteobacteria bacterium]